MPRSLGNATVPAIDDAGRLNAALAQVTRRVVDRECADRERDRVRRRRDRHGFRVDAGSGSVLGLAAAAVMLWRGRVTRDAREAARLIERARPECRNVVITAEELLGIPSARRRGCGRGSWRLRARSSSQTRRRRLSRSRVRSCCSSCSCPPRPDSRRREAIAHPTPFAARSRGCRRPALPRRRRR